MTTRKDAWTEDEDTRKMNEAKMTTEDSIQADRKDRCVHVAIQQYLLDVFGNGIQRWVIMKKPAYQPPPNKAARFANSINMRYYKPGMTGTAPKIDPPKVKRKPPKPPNGSNCWLFDPEEVKQKKKAAKAMDVVLKRHRQKVKRRMDALLFGREKKQAIMEVWDQ